MDVFVKDKTLRQLYIAKKHLNTILFLFENHFDCLLVVKNSRKAQRALENARKIMLQGHLEYCLREKLTSLNGSKGFDEMVQIFRN